MFEGPRFNYFVLVVEKIKHQKEVPPKKSTCLQDLDDTYILMNFDDCFFQGVILLFQMEYGTSKCLQAILDFRSLTLYHLGYRGITP